MRDDLGCPYKSFRLVNGVGHCMSLITGVKGRLAHMMWSEAHQTQYIAQIAGASSKQNSASVRKFDDV